MARSTMAYLIAEVRGRIDAGTDIYQEQHGSGLWFDPDHIQEVLDRHRVDIWHETIRPQIEYESGTAVYKTYYTGQSFLERTSGGTAVFYLENANQQIGSTNYSVDYQRGVVTFTSNQIGSAYFMTARSYDPDAAAAEIWRIKASWYATSFNFSTDNHRVDKGAVMKQCMDMATFYESRSKSGGFNVTTLYRSDAVC